MNKKKILATLVMLSLMQGNVYADTINGQTLLGKVYDDYKVFENDEYIFFMGGGEFDGEITFNKGAEFNFKDTVFDMGDYNYPPKPETDGANVVINVGAGSNLKVNGTGQAANVSYYSSLIVNGEGADITFSSTGIAGDQNAAVYVGNGVSYFSVDGKNLTLNGGYDAALSATHSSSVDINLTGDLITKNGGSGLLIQQSQYGGFEYDNHNAHMMVNAENIYLSTLNEDLSASGEDDQILAGLYVGNYNGNVEALDTDIVANNNLSVTGYNYGFRSEGKADIYLSGKNVEFKTLDCNTGRGTGLYLNSQSNYFSGMNGGPQIRATGEKIDIYGGKYGIRSAREGNLILESNTDININSKTESAIQGNHNFNMNTNSNNLTIASENGYGIELTDKSNLNLTANEYINVSGGGLTDSFNLTNSDVTLKTVLGTINNRIAAEDGSTFKAQALEGSDAYYSIKTHDDDALYSVSDTDEKSVIDIETSAIISNQGNETDYADSNNSTYAAIHALRNSEINLKTEGKQYEIYGNVLAGRGVSSTDAEHGGDEGGVITIGGSGTIIKGDVFAGNSGKVDITLNDGLLDGRVDGYSDASLGVIFRPVEFGGIDVDEAGTVTLNMGTNSTWDVRGQSYITNLNFMDNAQNAVVDLTKNDEFSSVTIDNLSGSGTFNMRLNSAEHSQGDMLYIVNGSGNHMVNIVGGIQGGLENISEKILYVLLLYKIVAAL